MHPRPNLLNSDGSPDLSARGGNDFVLNSTSAGNQLYQDVTGLADGRFFVTWQSPGGLRGRLFNADGTALANDFLLNTTAGASRVAAVDELSDGRILVSWSSTDTGDGSGGCIRARIFNADGSAIGNDFIVNKHA